MYFYTFETNCIHTLEKRIIERVMKYFKDKTENFDDYYPYINNQKRNCELQNAYYWIKLFIYLYKAKNTRTILFKFGGEIVLT